MQYLTWFDGRVVDSSTLRFDVPYIRYRLHTLNHRVYDADIAVNILRSESATIFGFSSLISALDINRLVSRLLDTAYAPTSVSVPVDLRLDSYGRLSFTLCEPTFGQGYYLRACSRKADSIVAANYDLLVQTSVTESQDAMYDAVVRIRGAEEAILVDSEGMVISRPWRPIFIIDNNRAVFTPIKFPTAEYQRIARAIKSMGLKLSVVDIPWSAMCAAQEVFVADAMAVTAYDHIGSTAMTTFFTRSIVERVRM